MQHKFRGTGIALVTPFLEDKKIDFIALKRLVGYNLNNGINYLVVLGTTAESTTLNMDEKQAVLQCVIYSNNNRVPVVLGIGGNHTTAVVEQFSQFDLTDVDAILSVSPYYNKPSQEGIYQHYKQLAINAPKPIILYNVPGRTQSNISAATTLRLANDFDNIIGIKEASGDLNQIGKIIKNAPQSFFVVSGDDALTLPTIAIGGQGVISVLGNAFPKEFSSMVRFALNGNYNEAQKIHLNFIEIIDCLFSEGNPTGVKYALQLQNICESTVRLPLVEMTNQGKQNMIEATKLKIKNLIQ